MCLILTDWSPLILAALRWQYPQAAVVVLPLTAVLTAYVVWAYLPQVRQVGRPWAWALPGLRLTALGVLALSLLRPAVARPRTPAELGPVLVMIDDSMSMGVADTGRPVGQRVAVAAALGRLPAGARDAAVTTVEAGAEDLAGLTDAVARARNEVGYARLAGRDTEAATARLDATIDAVHRAAASLGGQVRDAGSIASPRLERTLAVLATVPSGVDREAWLDRAGDRARTAAVEASAARAQADTRLYDDDPAVHDAADAIARQSRMQLAWAAVFDPHAGLVARLGSDVPVVAYTLGERVAPIADAAVTPAPVGLVSDLSGGVRTVLERLAAPADAEPPRAVVVLSDGRQVSGSPPESVAAAGVPVFTVALASPAASPNVAVTDLSVPRFAYPGETITCHVTLRPTAVAGLSTNVTFTVGSGGNRPIDVAHSEVRRVTFGDRPTTLAFTWTPTEAGVVCMSVRAAPVPGEATDADNAAQAWMAVVGSTVRVAAMSAGHGRSFESACISLSTAPTVRLMPGAMLWTEQVARADVAMMFDVTARSLTPSGWEAVNRLVADRGGGAVLVAGDGGFGPGLSPMSPLGRLLPFAGSPPAVAVRAGGPLQPDPDGPRLADDPIDSARQWAAMPTFDRYVPLVPLRSDARPLLSIGGQPVLAERQVGAGRALCLGSDQSWRWRDAPGGPSAADRFWLDLVRMAAGDPYTAEAGGIAMGVDPLAPLPGQAIHVRLRLDDAEASPAAGRVRVLGAAGGVVRTVPFRWRSGGRADVSLGGLPAGEYSVEPVAGGPRVTVHVRPSADAELADLSGDDGFLRRLAEATGGQAFRLDELGAVAAALSAPTPEPPRPVELRLWDGPYLYAGVLGLLTAEWALRRRAGLA